MADLTEDLKALRVELDEAEEYLRVAELRARLPQLETEMGRPDLWDDADRARIVQTEFTAVKEDLDLFDELSGLVDDAETLYRTLPRGERRRTRDRGRRADRSAQWPVQRAGVARPLHRPVRRRRRRL